MHVDATPYCTSVGSAREMGRRRLIGEPNMFGSPSPLIIRAVSTRQRQSFYNTENLHANSEVCLELLRQVALGFVQQVFTYTRRRNEAVTTSAGKLNTQKASHHLSILWYGLEF